MHEAGFVHLGNGWAPAWPVAWRASAVVLGRVVLRNTGLGELRVFRHVTRRIGLRRATRTSRGRSSARTPARTARSPTLNVNSRKAHFIIANRATRPQSIGESSSRLSYGGNFSATVGTCVALNGD